MSKKNKNQNHKEKSRTVSTSADVMPAVYAYKLIYIFAIDDEAHKGLLKIGDTTIATGLPREKLSDCCAELNQAAKARIDQYTATAGIRYHLLHTTLAVRINTEGKLESFRDYAVHQVLRNTNKDYYPAKYNEDNSPIGKEWFRVDLQTAVNAINAVKENRTSLNLSETQDIWTPILFRPEQEEAIKKTVQAFKGKKERFLWNAKMRFGKTLSALEVVKKLKYIQHTIIITHRPTVNDSWYEDFKKIFAHDRPDYRYGSKEKQYGAHCGENWDNLKSGDGPFVYFASIQDLRGSASVGGGYDKNNDVFNYPWDLVIVDEAHEGTQTILGDKVIEHLVNRPDGHKAKLLALSGTPFNIAEKFEEDCYTWDYVMEQKSKAEWDKLHPFESNPYADLPTMEIRTFALGQLFEKYQEFEDSAFNFREFFRTEADDTFIHEEDVKRFLDLLCHEGTSHYPFTSEAYRQMFRHTLWVVPGVQAARALERLLAQHSVFGAFKVANVAGEGNIEKGDALKTVRHAIDDNDYTITLTCGKLTTGTTVPEWSAVLYLAGTFSTSAQSYMQTIFRVQTPCNKYGMSKTHCYVFDFAPDRSLKVIAEALSVSHRAGKTTESERKVLGDFLNYCPIISFTGSEMTPYDAGSMMRHLKRAYAERVVKNGFEDNHLYNIELLNLDEEAISKFNNLRDIVKTSGAEKLTPNNIPINNQGFTEEKYEQLEQLDTKPAKELSDDEKSQKEELKARKELRDKAIKILKAISIRIPLLIYGANTGWDGAENAQADITLQWLVDNIDDVSWEEFLPSGVTKELFKGFIKYYDEDVFLAAGQNIRQSVRDADALLPLQRIQKITKLFNGFKNPDKETVLTPWRVVNMHLGDCLGGYLWIGCDSEDCCEDKEYLTDDGTPNPQWVDQGEATAKTFDNPKARILEINSKTGLYPLYATFSIWARKCLKVAQSRAQTAQEAEELAVRPLPQVLDIIPAGEQKELWLQVVAENIFVVCKTKMARAITKRTLLGFGGGESNLHAFDDLLMQMKEKQAKLVEQLKNRTTWKKGEGKMEFDAVIGNPPYMITTGGGGKAKNQAMPIYQYFVNTAIAVEPRFVSMIMPSRWFAGGMERLEPFRRQMMSDTHICFLTDYAKSKDCFPNVSISGGVCYFKRDKMYLGPCSVINYTGDRKTLTTRYLNEYPVIVRFNDALNILSKIQQLSSENLSGSISSVSPYGIPTTFKGDDAADDNFRIYTSSGMKYIKPCNVKKNVEMLSSYRVMLSQTTSEHAGEPDQNGMFKIFTSTMRVLAPKELCNHSYITVGQFNENSAAENMFKYLQTRFVRLLVMLTITSIHLTDANFVFVPIQDFTEQSDLDWSQSIDNLDKQLYKKYNLTSDEIAFIESMIKPMK
ncbi:MAG: Eco57I restriction-modification methylase domain-containing protein [bacterium]|nr:Eco57I restriction-modification methylase domain-containing protein [bacterium]